MTSRLEELLRMNGPSTPPTTPAPPVDTSRRNPWIALVLGLAAPGLGFLYAGAPVVAVVVLLLAATATAAVPALALWQGVDLQILYALMRAAFVSLWLPTAIFGAVYAHQASGRPLKRFQHVWFYLGFALVTWLAHDTLRTQVVAAHIASAGLVEGDSLVPTARSGDVFVIVKQGFDARALQPGQLVAVNAAAAGQQPRILATRVVATAGATVVVERGVVIRDGAREDAVACTDEERARARSSSADVTALCAAVTTGNTRHLAQALGSGVDRPVVTVRPEHVYVLPDHRGSDPPGGSGEVSVTSILGTAEVLRR
jgi:hypothetical protein